MAKANNSITNFDKLLSVLPELWQFHGPKGNTLQYLKALIHEYAIQSPFRDPEPVSTSFGPFGEIYCPYVSLGGDVSTLNCFDIDELILFSFYWSRRHTYRKVLDIGANIGLHTLLLAKCGFEVDAIEPDPKHIEILSKNLSLNKISGVSVQEAAVSNTSGKVEFIRIKNNTTGSHITGSKSNVYGDVDRFAVNAIPFSSLVKKYDFIKIDAEGHERHLLLDSNASDWADTDAMIEVGSKENARAIFAHFHSLGISLFTQKTGWQRIDAVADMPESYRDGSLFINGSGRGPWETLAN